MGASRNSIRPWRFGPKEDRKYRLATPPALTMEIPLILEITLITPRKTQRAPYAAAF